MVMVLIQDYTKCQERHLSEENQTKAEPRAHAKADQAKTGS